MLPDWLIHLIQPRPTCIQQLELLWPELSVIQQAEVLERIKTSEYGQWLFQPIWTLASTSHSDYLRYRALEHLQCNKKEWRAVLDSDPCPLVRSLSAQQLPSSAMSPQNFWNQNQLNRLQLLARYPSPILLDRILTHAADHQLCQKGHTTETELASLILEVMPGLLRFSRHNLSQSADYMGEPLFNAFHNLWRLTSRLPGRAGYELLNRLPWQLDGRALACARDLIRFSGLLKWGLEARLEKDYSRLPHDLMKELLCQPIALEAPLIEYWIETVRWDLTEQELTLIRNLPEPLQRSRLRLLALHAPLEFGGAKKSLNPAGQSNEYQDASSG